MSDIWWLRIGIVVAGALLMAAIYFFGRPRKQSQGRKLRDESAERTPPRTVADVPARTDAVFAQDGMPFDELSSDAAPPPSGPEVGKRDREDFDKS